MGNAAWSMSYEDYYGVSAIEAGMIRGFWRAMGPRLYRIAKGG